MKTIFILILALTGGSYGAPTITHVEFNSLQSCTAALKQIKASRGRYVKSSAFGPKTFKSNYSGICVKK